MLDIHTNINSKLNSFIKKKMVPNIIFHGPHGSGKKTIMSSFLDSIYHDKKEGFIITINCGYNNGIKYIRDKIKQFSKTHVSDNKFKTIILLNADKLTIDAQSAIRRCIEIFSISTRFFMIIHNKDKLLKPIISRFCYIHVPYPIINNVEINLHRLNLHSFTEINKKRSRYLNQSIYNLKKNKSLLNIFKSGQLLYKKAYSGNDIINYVVKNQNNNSLIVLFNKLKMEIRNDELLIIIFLYFYLFRCDYILENISII